MVFIHNPEFGGAPDPKSKRRGPATTPLVPKKRERRSSKEDQQEHAKVQQQISSSGRHIEAGGINTIAARRTRLDLLLSDIDTFKTTVASQFETFDKDGNGRLSADEVKICADRLCERLDVQKFPNIESLLVEIVGSGGGSELSKGQFTKLFYNLVKRIRVQWYPDDLIKFDRDAIFKRSQVFSLESLETKYEKTKKLGAGAFGEVWLVRERTTHLYRVCKYLDLKSARCPQSVIESEIRIMRTADHPNCLRIFEVFETRDHIMLIMEYLKGGDLEGRLESYSDRKVRPVVTDICDVMCQVLYALRYLHNLGITHKDLKPANVMMVSDKSWEVKVIDFGVSEVFKDERRELTVVAGSPLYMAPEMFLADTPSNEKVDIWSAGVMFYQCLTGAYPFIFASMAELKRRIHTAEPDWEKLLRRSNPEIVDLIQNMLNKNATERWAAGKCIKHSCLRGFYVDPGKPFKISSSTVMTMRLKATLKDSNLRNIIWFILMLQLDTSGMQAKQLSTCFRYLDTTAIGKVSYTEFKAAFDPLLNEHEASTASVSSLFQALDISGTGYLSYTEFLAGAYLWTEPKIAVVRLAFNEMGDGEVITTDQLCNLLGSGVGLELDPLIVRNALDGNGDGRVSWHEFIQYLGITREVV